MRKEIKDFADQMEKKLKENDNKGGWEECSKKWLLIGIEVELGELKQALEEGSVGDIVSECADIANFCMMIADNAYTVRDFLEEES